MSAIIFDLDGTLVDSAPDITAALNAALASVSAPPLPAEKVRSFIGRGAPVLVARARAELGLSDALQAPMLRGFLEIYEDAVGLTRLYPGVVDALDDLLAAGHVLGLCTNKPIAPTHNVLEHFDLTRPMTAVIGGDSLTLRKPDPAPLYETMRLMGAKTCIFVGDSETDCETAAAAGAPFLLHLHGYRNADIADMPHAASFGDWSVVPPLIGDLAKAGTPA